jgi:hypothetical protein
VPAVATIIGLSGAADGWALALVTIRAAMAAAQTKSDATMGSRALDMKISVPDAGAMWLGRAERRVNEAARQMKFSPFIRNDTRPDPG